MLCAPTLHIIRNVKTDCFFCGRILPDYDYYFCTEHDRTIYNPDSAGCGSFARTTMSIEIKNVIVLRRLLEQAYHPQLIELVCWFADTAGSIFVTSAYRDDPSSVHGWLRGVDLRSWIYANPRRLCKRANEVWKYDPKRRPKKRCAKVHDVGQGIHIHLQVHEYRTIYIGG
jgi:hypothetical protein